MAVTGTCSAPDATKGAAARIAGHLLLVIKIAQEEALYLELFEDQLQSVNRHRFATGGSVGHKHASRGECLDQCSGGHAADRIDAQAHRTISHEPERLFNCAGFVDEHDVASGGLKFFQQFLA